MDLESLNKQESDLASKLTSLQQQRFSFTRQNSGSTNNSTLRRRLEELQSQITDTANNLRLIRATKNRLQRALRSSSTATTSSHDIPDRVPTTTVAMNVAPMFHATSSSHVPHQTTTAEATTSDADVLHGEITMQTPLTINIVTESSEEVIHATPQEATTTVHAPSHEGPSHVISRGRRRQIKDTWTFTARDCYCRKCNALMWKEERTYDSSLRNPRFNLCCNDGDIKLPSLPPTPQYLAHQLTNTSFRKNIRAYNSLFCCTSMGGRIDHSVTGATGPYSFRISGENYHRIGSLLPPYGEMCKFIQLYIHDTEHELQNRVDSVYGRGNNADGVDMNVLEGLKDMFDAINPYVKIFRAARDALHSNNTVDLRLQIINTRTERQYIQPTADEVAALIIGDTSGQVSHRDIILFAHDGRLRRINETHPSYMPLQYPLLFPYGTDGWRCDIQNCASDRRRRNNVTMREFYAFRLQFRVMEGWTLLQGGRLFQQFTVDCWAAIEHNNLNYIKTHQSNLRAELYQGIEDALGAGDVDACAVGRRIVLPSSFTGGPRNMMQHYQDAVAICRYFGPPDLFITFTCNPNWKEITDELKRLPGQRAEDRPDITARVFRIKQKQLMDYLKKQHFFGKVVADISVIEYQKRGLPHTHITLTLIPEDKPKTPEQIDEIICAELPDQQTDPIAFDIVTKCLIHGPCGDGYPNKPCMVNGKCSKHYPKRFCETTTIDHDGFVAYRRRNDPSKRILTADGVTIDNRWVVPYNRDLVVLMNAHINIERVAFHGIYKYIYKYMNKGVDRVNVLVQNNSNILTVNGQRQYIVVDEIRQYLDCRYLSSVEACWKIFKFECQRQYPSVERLQYHLQNHQFVVFNDNSHLYDVVDRNSSHHTMLTKWFEANTRYHAARPLTYVEFPTAWVWNRTLKEWSPRRSMHRSIGRLPFAHPNSGERYFLRMLLHIVRGAESFEHIRTVNGILYPTFKAACVALGLLDDDNEWHEALTEASTWASARTLHNMFCTMLMFSEVANPLILWDNHWKSLTDDIRRRIRTDMMPNTAPISDDGLKNMGLIELEVILNRNGRSLGEFPPMPLPSLPSAAFSTNRLIREEMQYDCASEITLFEELHRGLNDEQKLAFDAIIESYLTNTGDLFFVSGSGGTGKTYLWRTLIAKFRSDKKIVLSVASSGIASLLLPGGRTSHSRFKIPIHLDADSTCNISCNSELAKLIQEASAIIWDEAPMTHRHAFEAVDRTFKDILKHTQHFNDAKPFGGKLFILGGDFRQILPVVPKGRREETVSSTIKESLLWNRCRTLHLTKNMRISASNLSCNIRQNIQLFSDWLLSVGEGKIHAVSFTDSDETNWIKIPDQYIIKKDTNVLNTLIQYVYPDLQVRYNDDSYLKERAILAPKNNDVDGLNSNMLSMLPGDARKYLSSDTICSTDSNSIQDNLHPPEVLHSLNFPGFPSHCLELKEGAPVILLRNLNQTSGLCNGTRLIISRMGDKVIEAKIITGTNIGDIVLIPRISLTPQSLHTPFPMKRRQFPLKLAFAMTINKSQGQTLKNVGIYLPDPVFSHGQLYVALSRVTSPTGLNILISNEDGIPPDFTKNVVYTEVFNNL